MAFWKRAVASLGLMGILASPAFAKVDGERSQAVTQIDESGQDSKHSQRYALKIPEMKIRKAKATLSDDVLDHMGKDVDRKWMLRRPDPDSLDRFFPSEEFLLSLKPYEEEGPFFSDWTILEYRLTSGFNIDYTLPNDFHLDLDGTIKGYGFHWNIFDDEFYYKDFAIREYFTKLGDGKFKDPVKIGDMSLDDFLEQYRNDRSAMNTAFNEHFSDLQEDFKEILLDNYSDEFAWAFAVELFSILPKYGADDGDLSPDEYPELYKELEEFAQEFYGDEVSDEDRARMKEAIDDFAKDMGESFDELDISEALYLIAADPKNNITIGDKTLGDLIGLAKGFTDMLDMKKTPNGLEGHKVIEGMGTAHGEIAFDYKVGKRGRTGDFSQTLMIDQELYGRAYADLIVTFEKGAPLISLLDDDIAQKLVDIAAFSGVDLSLPNIGLDGKLGYRSHSILRRAESYELSEPIKHGKEGVGAVFLHELAKQSLDDIEVAVQLDTIEQRLTASVSEHWQDSRDERKSVLFYYFKEVDTPRYWYVMSEGLETYMRWEEVKWRRTSHSLSFDFDGTYETDSTKETGGWKDERLRFKMSPSIGAGIRGGPINHFFTYTEFPHKRFTFGTMIAAPFFATKMSATMHLEEPRARIFENPIRGDSSLRLESHLTLLDDEGTKKVMDYYVETEKGRVTPSMRDETDERNASAKLYSGLDGLMLSWRIVDSDYRLRFLWGLDSSVFMGASYIGNLDKDVHGGDIVLGYEDLMLSAGYGGAVNGMNSHKINLSLAGTMRSKYMVYIDVHGMTPGRIEDSYYERHFREEELRITGNISGPFDEAAIMSCIFKFECGGDDD